MTDDVLPMDLLEKLPIFAGMDDVERQQLVDIASTIRFAPGDVVLDQGGDSQVLMVVLEGCCQVIKQAPDDPQSTLVLAELEPYDHFGEMSFFHAAPHSASVKAVSPMKLLQIERRDYDVLIAEGRLSAYKLAYNMIDELADRLRRMDNWVSKLATQEPQKRESEWSTFRDRLFDSWNL